MVRPMNTCSQARDYFYEKSQLFLTSLTEGGVDQGGGGVLTTLLHLKCYIWCSTWPEKLNEMNRALSHLCAHIG